MISLAKNRRRKMDYYSKNAFLSSDLLLHHETFTEEWNTEIECLCEPKNQEQKFLPVQVLKSDS